MVWIRRLALPLFLASAISMPAHAQAPFLHSIYEAYLRNEVQKKGFVQVGERDFVVPDEIFEISTGNYREVFKHKNPNFPANAVAYYNPDVRVWDGDYFEWSRRIFEELTYLENYSMGSAERLTGILTGDDHIIMSESGRSELIHDHERMHRALDHLPYEKRRKLELEWVDALKRNRIISRRVVEIRFDDKDRLLATWRDECDDYCQVARQDMHHFVIYLCQRLIMPYEMKSPVKDVVECSCIPPGDFEDANK
ncbi:MAG: hypothetical protein HYW25_04805 [Candidatus Aenigmarchaeota archaeon]|nr:hypothetical protein [Candidatus Aenigmarchaeota archaeon]